MMKLYHGGLTPVKKPRILSPDRVGDFGIGFYTTSDYEQACRFVRSKIAQRHVAYGVLSVFELPDDFLADRTLKVKIFEQPDEEWVDFVMSNRRDINFQHDFDIIKGPVADDQVYASLALYEGDFLNKAELIERLRVKRLVDQILFHTEKSLLSLNFTESEEIKCRK